MNCQELLRILNDHVDGTLELAVCAEFEAHLAGCHPCQVVVDNIRHTITIYRAGEPYELPLAFRRRLHDALREHWAGRPPPAERAGEKGEQASGASPSGPAPEIPPG